MRIVSSVINLIFLGTVLCVICIFAQPPAPVRTHNSTKAEAADIAAIKARSVLIKGSSFQMGTDASDVPKLMRDLGVKRQDVFSSEVPRHKVKIGSFYIDKYEVTNAQFREFLLGHSQWRKDKIPANLHNGKYLADWNGDEYPADRGDFPVVFVSWHAAVAYCQAQNMRLPTEAEWEYAARGGLSGKAFPWGDQLPDATLANYSKSGFGHAVKVGSYPPNGYGLYDMAGNVWEYLADDWGSYPQMSKTQHDPVAGGDLFVTDSYLQVTSRRVIRGGSWGGSAINLRVTYRDSHPSTGAGDHVGFRCAASLK